MADSEDIRLLELDDKDLQRCDFSGYSAVGRTFVGLDFRGAILKLADFSNCRFESCNFQEAQLDSANFTASRFTGCQFNHVAFAVNFDKAVFEGGEFKCLVTRSKFRNASFVRVNVKGLRFGDDNNLEEATADSATDFEGVKMPRALSRLPIFSQYMFERGELVRKPSRAADPENDSSLASSPARIEKLTIENCLTTNSQNAQILSQSLAHLIDDFLANSPTPNDPDKLDFHEHYVDLLVKVRADAVLIASSLAEAEQDQGLGEASASVVNMRGLIQDWWNENGAKVVDFGANVSLIGVGTALLSFCGAPPVMATTICGILSGSKAIADYLNKAQAGDE